MVSWETTKDFGEALTVFAVLALAWGIIHRGLPGPRAADVFLGVLFGGAATYCMLDPLVIMPGVFVDLRSVPVALAAIYLRPCGAIAALAVALTARLMIGGPGIASGSAGLLLTGMAGRAMHRPKWWARLGGTGPFGAGNLCGVGRPASSSDGPRAGGLDRCRPCTGPAASCRRCHQCPGHRTGTGPAGP
jgi:hypothetical protein